MISFDKLYGWLFKSFNISGETDLLNRLEKDGFSEAMIIKRSWIFALFIIWIPLSILTLSGMSIWIALDSIDVPVIKYTLVVGNILMSLILSISSLVYIHHFRKVHSKSTILSIREIRQGVEQGDKYFKNFFNWSVTNQLILAIIILIEILLMIAYGSRLGDHFWILSFDIFVIIIEFGLLRQYRKRMMDLEMDYNIVVKGKVFFVNQSGVLSTIQTIDGDKIKTVQSLFPSKIASFFNYGTIHILTEGDSPAMMGTMSMYYVTDPDSIVADIHSLIDESEKQHTQTQQRLEPQQNTQTSETTIRNPKNETRRHAVDTRERIRDVLR